MATIARKLFEVTYPLALSELLWGASAERSPLAQNGNSDHLAKEMNHLLGPRQSAQIAVDDDPVEAVARDGDPEPVDFEETETNYAIGWKGTYRIEGDAFVYAERKSGRVTAILGYPTAKIALSS